jgi:hypothetical protein
VAFFSWCKQTNPGKPADSRRGSSRSPRVRLLLVLALVLLVPGRALAQPADVVRPELISGPDAPYPDDAHGDTSVLLELDLAEDGTVTAARTREGEPPFEAVARVTVLSWRFSPATRNGIPIRARILARIDFHEPAPPAAAPVPPPAPAAAENSSPDSAAVATPPAPVAANPPEPVSITVIGEQRQELGSIYIPKADARRVPGAFADPFRVVEVLPGVAPILSGLPYFFVRGAPPGDVGYSIDGIPVPLLFHVGAGPSVIAPAMVDKVDLFPAAFPARFGRYAGAIMAGETTTPSKVGRAEAQARIFDIGGMVEQPFAGGRGTALVGGRYSYTKALLAKVAPDYSLEYGDYQARLSYATSARDSVSVFAFGASDKVENVKLARPLFDVAFHRLDLRWDRRSDDTQSRLAVTLGTDRVLSAEDNLTDPGAHARSQRLGVRADVNHRLSQELRLRGGLDASTERFSAEFQRLQTMGAAYPARTDARAAAYADAIWRPLRGVEMVPGFRLDVERSRRESFVFPEPRLSTLVRVRSGVAWLTSFGLTHQLASSSIAVPAEQPDALELATQRAWQTSQGIEFVLPESMLGRATAFHSFIDASGSDLVGRNYGLELFLRRNFSEKLGGFLSYTLSRAERSSGSFTRASPYDRRHVLSAVLGYDFGSGIRVGGRAYYASGRPYAVDCSDSVCIPISSRAPLETADYSGRLSAFMRVDVRLEKRWTFASGAWIAGTFEWFNALLAKEASGVERVDDGELREISEDPLTLPSIGIEAGY